jgi:hypothetical protein
MKNHLFRQATLVGLLLAATATAFAQQIPNCAGKPKYSVEFYGFSGSTPSDLLPMNVKLFVQNPATGTIFTREAGTISGTGTTLFAETFAPVVTQITYTNTYGTGYIDSYEPFPQSVPTGNPGWCYEFTLVTTVPPLLPDECFRIRVRPIRC